MLDDKDVFVSSEDEFIATVDRVTEIATLVICSIGAGASLSFIVASTVLVIQHW